MPGIHLTAAAAGTLQQGRQAYIGIAAAAGPHVTPELYAWSSGRLWFASATTTLKTRVLRRRGRGAALVSAGGRDVLLRGPVESFDVRHPVELGRAAADLPAAALAWLGYTVRNAPDLVAFGADLVLGRLGSRVPPLRVLHALTPTSVAVVEDDTVVGRWGRWPGGVGDGCTDREVGGAPAVAALPGPVVLPGAWDDATSTFHASPAVLALSGVSGTFPMSVVLDEFVGFGPAAKEGTLLRGEGRLARAGHGAVVLDPDRQVEWIGTAVIAGPA